MNNELKVVGNQMFMGIEIPVIEGGFGEDKRIVTAKTISEIHGIEIKEVTKSINRIKAKRLKEGSDYLDVIAQVNSLPMDIEQVFGIKKEYLSRTQNIYVLSERGYSKLIKAMDDDKSWDIMDQFVDNYFTMRKELQEVLTAEDRYVLALFRAKSRDEMLMLVKQHEEEVVAPLRASVDKYERFLCEKTQLLKKSELATKLDTNTNTLAALFKKLGIYTPKNSKLKESFVEKFPTIKMYDESDESFTDKKTGKLVEKKGWQWTFLGAKTVVDYLIGLGYVTFTENDGFKLNKANT